MASPVPRPREAYLIAGGLALVAVAGLVIGFDRPVGEPRGAIGVVRAVSEHSNAPGRFTRHSYSTTCTVETDDATFYVDCPGAKVGGKVTICARTTRLLRRTVVWMPPAAPSMGLNKDVEAWSQAACEWTM